MAVGYFPDTNGIHRLPGELPLKIAVEGPKAFKRENLYGKDDNPLRHTD